MTSDIVENRRIGLAAAFGVLFVWSGFYVVSRAGLLSPLKGTDIVALRILVAGAITLPFAWRWWPRHISFWKAMLLAATGPAVLYSLIFYAGLRQTSVAFAGVFANGSLPIFTVLIVGLVLGAWPGRVRFAAISVIVLGTVVVGSSGMRTGNAAVSGIIFFLAASALLSVYTFFVRHWGITPKQALAVLNVPSALIFLPVWLTFLPSGISETPVTMILLQAAYQGLGPGILAVILYALAARHLGPTATSGFSAAVPATATVLAIPFVGEVPELLDWFGIALVTIGLFVMVYRS